MFELPAGSWWDWDVLHFDGSQLRLAAGHDLTYHHGLEVVFTDVTYMACPTQFRDPRFRKPTLDERALVHRHVGEEPPVIVAFDVDAPAGVIFLPVSSQQGPLRWCPAWSTATGVTTSRLGNDWLRTCDRRSHREVRAPPEPPLLPTATPAQWRARTIGGVSVLLISGWSARRRPVRPVQIRRSGRQEANELVDHVWLGHVDPGAGPGGQSSSATGGDHRHGRPVGVAQEVGVVVWVGHQ